MAIREWTVGQLVVFWAGLALFSFLIGAGIVPTPVHLGAALGAGVWVFLLLAMPGLVVTWKWLGRRRSNHGATDPVESSDEETP